MVMVKIGKKTWQILVIHQIYQSFFTTDFFTVQYAFLGPWSSFNKSVYTCYYTSTQVHKRSAAVYILALIHHVAIAR